MDTVSKGKTKNYQAKQGDSFIILTLFLIGIFGLIIWWDYQTFFNKPFLLLPILSPVVLLIWIFVDTHYKIENNQLICTSGFIKKKVDIGKIKKIQVGKTMWVGFKMATASKGLIIHYNTYDEIYISPKNQKEFMAALVEINSEISVEW